MAKKVISFTIDEDLLKKWKEYARKHAINSSLLVEDLLNRFLRDYVRGNNI